MLSLMFCMEDRSMELLASASGTFVVGNRLVGLFLSASMHTLSQDCMPQGSHIVSWWQ